MRHLGIEPRSVRWQRTVLPLDQCRFPRISLREGLQF